MPDPVTATRLATAADLEAVRAFDEFKGSRETEIRNGTCWVECRDTVVVGFASFEPWGLLGQPLLTYLCVRKEHRREGIARQLVQAVTAAARGRVLISSTEDWCVASQGLFTGLGWTPIGRIEGVNKDGSAELFYSIPLSE